MLRPSSSRTAPGPWPPTPPWRRPARPPKVGSPNTCWSVGSRLASLAARPASAASATGRRTRPAAAKQLDGRTCQHGGNDRSDDPSSVEADDRNLAVQVWLAPRRMASGSARPGCGVEGTPDLAVDGRAGRGKVVVVQAGLDSPPQPSKRGVLGGCERRAGHPLGRLALAIALMTLIHRLAIPRQCAGSAAARGPSIRPEPRPTMPVTAPLTHGMVGVLSRWLLEPERRGHVGQRDRACLRSTDPVEIEQVWRHAARAVAYLHVVLVPSGTAARNHHTP